MQRRVFKIIVLLVMASTLLAGLLPESTSQSSKVYVITVDGTIGAGNADYIISSINKATKENAALIIKLDTPGGLLSSTEDIVDRMLEEDSGIIVWVTPKGSWAFSAGTYILLASNFAVMDEGTSIGAAQPRPPDNKTTLAMAQWIKEIAVLRGRPFSIAQEFVTNNLTLGPDNAFQENVIDLVASDIDTILENLGLSGAQVESLEMSAVQRFLQVISDPNIVMLLFIIGFFGILAEMTTPGIGVPGVLGTICLILSFWGMGVLSLNYAGLALLAIGLLMLAYEIFTPSFGIFGGGGIVAIILGLMMVGTEPWVEVVGNLLKGVIVGMVVFFAYVLFQIRRSAKKKPAVGKEKMIGEFGYAASNLSPRGLVRIKNELWTAYCRAGAKKGDEIVVKDMKGNVLIVQKRKKVA